MAQMFQLSRKNRERRSWRYGKSRVMRLSNLHVPLYPHELQLFSWSVSIIEEQLVAGLYRSLRKNSNPMISVDHHYLRLAIRVNRVICETNFVTFSRGVDYEVVVEVEEEGTGVLVVDFASPVRLVLGDDLAAILGYELVLRHTLFEKYSPSSNVGGGE